MSNPNFRQKQSVSASAPWSKLFLIGTMLAVLSACGGTDSADVTTTDDAASSENVSIGNTLSGSFVSGQIGVADASIKAGGITQLEVNFVDGTGSAYTDTIDVSFSSDCITDELSTLEGDVSTSTGTLVMTYTAVGCQGADTVTALAVVLGSTISAVGDVVIEADDVLSVQYISATPEQLSLKGVGGNEISTITFKVVGQQSAPIVGESVTLSVSPMTGGLALAETEVVTNSSGEVTARLQSGTAHTTAVVTATHDATGISGSSAGIDISSGVPQAGRLSLAKDISNPRGFDYDGSEVVVTVTASDQFGNPVPDNTLISFASPEGGSIPSSCQTVAARCSVTWISADPRPADGRVTIMAHTVGAEDFLDTNGNFIFDDTDQFDTEMDLDEPYIDGNENGMYDVGEFFYDFNVNGSFDVGDNLWNGPLCEHSSLCGISTAGIYRTSLIVMSTDDAEVHTSSTCVMPGSGGASPEDYDVIRGDTLSCQLVLSDANGNSLPDGTTITMSTEIGEFTGLSSFTVGENETGANGPYNINFQHDSANINTVGTWELIIDVPGVQEQLFVWAIDVN